MKAIGINLKLMFFGLILFFSHFCIANASIEITEVMYDLDGTDTGREWVEVYNNGTESIDFSRWYFFSDNIKHALVPQGNSNLSPGGYAVISQDASKFRVDWPSYSGLIFDSSWTGFSNDGETIALKDPDLNIVSQISFTSSQGGSGDGNSLQKINNSWSGATPTPGLPNQSGTSGGGGGGGSLTITPTSENKTTLKKEIENPKIVTTILAKNTAFVDMPLRIDFKTTGLRKEQIVSGRFAWSFGDGTGFSMQDYKEFEHTYKYPGEYVMSLSYYSNIYEKNPEATDRIIIKVLPAEVSISSVGNTLDPFVELSNRSNYEIDISRWYLKSYAHSFPIPEGTVILSNSKIKIPPTATGFTYDDISHLTLEDSKGELVTTYPKYNSSDNMNLPDKGKTTPQSINKDSNIVDLNNLGASAANTKVSNQSLAILGLVLVIIVGIMTVILVQKNSNKESDIDDNLNASDITIVE